MDMPRMLTGHGGLCAWNGGMKPSKNNALEAGPRPAGATPCLVRPMQTPVRQIKIRGLSSYGRLQ